MIQKMQPKRILVLEDRENISAMIDLKMFKKIYHYQVDTLSSFQARSHRLTAFPSLYALIVVDLWPAGRVNAFMSFIERVRIDARGYMPILLVTDLHDRMDQDASDAFWEVCEYYGNVHITRKFNLKQTLETYLRRRRPRGPMGTAFFQ